jgi:hypothetical protein
MRATPTRCEPADAANGVGFGSGLTAIALAIDLETF